MHVTDGEKKVQTSHKRNVVAAIPALSYNIMRTASCHAGSLVTVQEHVGRWGFLTHSLHTCYRTQQCSSILALYFCYDRFTLNSCGPF